MTISPFLARWDGERMEPLARFKKACDAGLVVGELYKVDCIEDRSAKSHSHYFARVHELWLNLPEGEAERWPTAEHLRKWALIKTGFCDERSIACSSKAEAQRLAAFVKPMDDFAVVAVSQAAVKVWTAKSQKKSAMGADDFQRSKTAVLELLESIVGLGRAEGEAA